MTPKASATIENVIQSTPTIYLGETLQLFFERCVESRVPALPCMDNSGCIIGFVSLKKVMGQDCLPNYLVELAGILHNDMHCTHQVMDKIHTLLGKNVDAYVSKPIHFVDSKTILIRAVALMEEYDSDYLFVADDARTPECDYKGLVTRLSVAEKMLNIEHQLMAHQST